MSGTSAQQRPPYSPKSSPFLNEVRKLMRLKHMSRRSLVPITASYASSGFGTSGILFNVSPGQRVADEHIYHPGPAEPGMHENHPRRYLTHLPDDLGFEDDQSS